MDCQIYIIYIYIYIYLKVIHCSNFPWTSIYAVKILNLQVGNFFGVVLRKKWFLEECSMSVASNGTFPIVVNAFPGNSTIHLISIAHLWIRSVTNPSSNQCSPLPWLGLPEGRFIGAGYYLGCFMCPVPLFVYISLNARNEAKTQILLIKTKDHNLGSIPLCFFWGAKWASISKPNRKQNNHPICQWLWLTNSATSKYAPFCQCNPPISDTWPEAYPCPNNWPPWRCPKRVS